MVRLYNASSDISLSQIKTSLDLDTKLLYFKDKTSNQTDIFIINKRTQTTPISSLWPDRNTLWHGTTQAYLVSMTSTRLLPKEQMEEKQCIIEEHNISGMVVKGAISWFDDILNGIRFSVIFSVPEDYKIINYLDFNGIIESKNNNNNNKKKKVQGKK